MSTFIWGSNKNLCTSSNPKLVPIRVSTAFKWSPTSSDSEGEQASTNFTTDLALTPNSTCLSKYNFLHFCNPISKQKITTHPSIKSHHHVTIIQWRLISTEWQCKRLLHHAMIPSEVTSKYQYKYSSWQLVFRWWCTFFFFLLMHVLFTQFNRRGQNSFQRS